MKKNLLTQQLDAARKHLASLRRQSALPRARQKVRWQRTLADLSASLKALRASAEEIHELNQKLTMAGRALEAEQRRYQELFECAPDGYLVTDALGIIQEANRAAEVLLRDSREHLAGKPMALFIGEAQRRAFRMQLRGLLHGFEESLPSRVFRIRPVSGASLEVSLSVAVTRSQKGRPTRLRWLMRDISEHMQFERYLAAQYAVATIFSKSDSLQETWPQLLRSICRCLGADLGELWELDTASGFLRRSHAWNAPGLRAVEFANVGQTESLAPGECCAGRVWETERAVWNAALAAVCRPKCARMAEKLGMRAVGALPIRTRKGVTGVLVLFLRELVASGEEMLQMLEALGRQIGDVLERRRMEAEIFELAAIVESSEDAIVGKSLDGRITSWNIGAERLYGYSAAEVRGQPIEILLPPENRREIDQLVGRIIRGERIDHLETTHVRKDGQTINVSLTVSPVRDAAGKLAGASLITRDITERKRAEDAVASAHAALERNREELRALAARLLTAQEEERRRVSRELHDDLSQKLALLMVEMETLERNLPSSSRKILERLRSFRGRAARLSDDARNLAHRLHPSILDDLGLAAAMHSYIRDFSAREGISVRFRRRRLPATIPPEIASCLYRILQESLRNAAKHASTPRISVTLTGAARYIRLTVKDWGVGFEPDVLKFRHRGLGIIGMEERVRLVNGTFCLRSGTGLGTEVVVQLPLPECVQ